jgi:hypothetical protein
MSNGSFSPVAIGVVTARVPLRFAADLVSPRARRIAMSARGGKNDARRRTQRPCWIRSSRAGS